MEPTEHRIKEGPAAEQEYNYPPVIKFLQRFNNFFSNVSSLQVADSTPIETQLELIHALKMVE